LDIGSRIVVGVSQSLAGLQALRRAVALARRSSADLHAVRVWAFSPPWRDAATARWRAEYAADAQRQIEAAFAAALGGTPSDLTVHAVVLEGFAGHRLVDYADNDTDLLVVGADRRTRRLPRRVGPVTRHCVAHAHCPVLTTPPPRMVHTGPVPRLIRELVHDIDRLRTRHPA
jgi:nucleotide-binding universal stress UspA family protein